MTCNKGSAVAARLCAVVVCVVCAVVLLLPLTACAAEFTTTAKAACVIERISGRVLFCKNADMRLPMASTTKIATALTVLRHVDDIDRVITIAPEACGIEGSSVYLKPDEKLTVRDLLYGLMLRSGNDCAVQLALFVSGSVDGFVELMNETARSLGCADTHFVTPHGLHDAEHFTTARELATIACAALDNPTFAEIVATRVYRCSGDSTRVFVNKNKLLSGYEYADGVKTGYTKAAGRCFVGSATKDGMKVVSVVLNCGPMFEECRAMCDVAFADYTMKQVVAHGKMCGSVVDKHGKRTFYCAKDGFAYPVKHGERITTQTILDNERQLLEVCLDGKQIAVLPLSAVK